MNVGNEKTENGKYNLQERTALFSETLIDLVRQIGKTTVTVPIIDQLIRSGTSIGANYCEADCAESKKDFTHKIGICKKEARETIYWLRLLARVVPELKERIYSARQEATELHLIFSAIVRTTRNGLAIKE